MSDDEKQPKASNKEASAPLENAAPESETESAPAAAEPSPEKPKKSGASKGTSSFGSRSFAGAGSAGDIDMAKANSFTEIRPRGWVNPHAEIVEEEEEAQTPQQIEAQKVEIERKHALGLMDEEERDREKEKLDHALDGVGEDIEVQEEKNLIREEKQEQRKKKRKYSFYALGGVVFALLVYMLFKPFEGGPQFGVCKTFLELQVRYPHKLRLSSVEILSPTIRIWFTTLDSFGEYKLQAIQCFFEPDPQYGLKLSKVEIDRRPVDSKIVENFNPAIPGILQNLPDLRLPAPISDKLQDLQIETEKFRSPLFN